MTFLALVFVFCSLCQALTRLFALFFLTRSPHYLRPWNAIEDYSFTQIDPIYDNRHLCTRSRTDGIKAMSLGFSGGKQVKKLPLEEIAVEFVYSRQEEMKTFSS